MREANPILDDNAFEKFHDLFLPVTDYFEIDDIKKLVENMHNVQPSDPNDFTLLVKSIRKLDSQDHAYADRYARYFRLHLYTHVQIESICQLCPEIEGS
jgi:hypothetical protein